MRKLLVPYNGSESSKAAFNFALDLAKTYGIELLVLSVIELPQPPTEVETEAILESSTKQYKNMFHELHRLAKEGGVSIRTEIVNGHPEEQILAEADKNKIDVIVMGHQSRGKFGRWFLGSVADRIVDHAKCTVIVVKRQHNFNGKKG